MSESNDYDLVVIGAGPGGYVAAIRAAQLGLRVACIEKESSLGGTCLNWGCIPSKALLDSSELYHQARTSFARHGIKADVSLDLPAMMARKDQVVASLTRGVASLFKKNKIESVIGTAKIVDARTLVVTNASGERALKTQRILIATGSDVVRLPNIPVDGVDIITSTEAIALKEVPRKLIVIGGGAIGLELGSVWKRLGAEVVVIEFLDRIMSLMDGEMTALLQRALEKQGITFKLKTAALSVEKVGGQLKLTWKSDDETGEELADKILVAVGRKPYTDKLGLQDAGVALDKRGFVIADAHYATNVPGIWAIGDVIGGAMLAHKAEEEGVAVAELMAGRAGHVNYHAVPSVVYTHPELAGVGSTEEQLKDKGVDYRVGKFPFAANGRAKCMDAAEGQVKILADAQTDRVLGMHILGPRASDLIAEGAVAIELAASSEDLARSVHAHPTLPEAIKEAAMAVEKRAIHF